MKRFNQNQIQTTRFGELKIRPSFLSKPTRKHYSKAGAAILAIIILHFVSQFIFFQSEKFESERTSAKTENERNNEQNDEQDVEIKTEYDARNSAIVTTSAPVPSTVQRDTKIAPSRSVIKKKEQRESRAERLRRAERILTGV